MIRALFAALMGVLVGYFTVPMVGPWWAALIGLGAALVVWAGSFVVADFDLVD